MTPLQEERDNWSEYRRLVMAGLKDLKEDLDGLKGDVQILRDDVLMLKVKASMWGAIAGFVGSAVVSYVFNLIVRK